MSDAEYNNIRDTCSFDIDMASEGWLAKLGKGE